MSKIVRKLSLRGEVVQKVMNQLNATAQAAGDETMKAKRSRRYVILIYMYYSSFIFNGVVFSHKQFVDISLFSSCS